MSRSSVTITIRRHPSFITGFLGVALVVGCAQEPADRPTVESAARNAPSPGPTVRPIPGPLATRHEAQESFDRARAALVRQDYSESARHLEKAATFIASHAAEAETGAIAALQGAAKELEMLAERLARREALTTRTLDRVFANANRAEAQHHLTRAVAALTDRNRRHAGEELIMAVDHLERAALDLRRPHDAESAAALSNARTLAELLMGGGIPTRAEGKRVTGQLMEELRRLCAIIDVEARACAIAPAR